MKPRLAKFVLAAQMLLFSFLIAVTLQAQGSSATLSGTITDPLGSPVPNASVSVKNVSSGQTGKARADSAGRYKFSNLAPGDYTVSVSAQGFESQSAQVTLGAGAAQKLDLALVRPSSGAGAPSLSELGFPSSEVKGSAQEQALLNKRSHMLQVHQKLGLVTAGFMVAALLTSGGAKGHHGLPGSPGGRNLHMALGATTGALYALSAYYAIRAPKISGVEARGPIRLHKALAWIHGPGMIATTILGIMAYNQLSNGERVHGIAKYHSTAALITAAAFGGAILSVSVKF
jgi:Carboxypeptidase regulatory-like domain